MPHLLLSLELGRSQTPSSNVQARTHDQACTGIRSLFLRMLVASAQRENYPWLVGNRSCGQSLRCPAIASLVLYGAPEYHRSTILQADQICCRRSRSHKSMFEDSLGHNPRVESDQSCEPLSPERDENKLSAKSGQVRVVAQADCGIEGMPLSVLLTINTQRNSPSCTSFV